MAGWPLRVTYQSGRKLLAAVIVVSACSGACKVFENKISSSTTLRPTPFQGDRVVVYRGLNIPGGRENSGNVFAFRSSRPVLTGLDQLRQIDFELLKNRSFALLTNNSGRDRELSDILQLLLNRGLPPALVLEPEHGLFGNHDDHLKAGVRVDRKTGLRFLSLYSANKKKPSSKDLKGIDLMVVDIQTLPVRCYTYISTLYYILGAAEKSEIEVMILDRTNPYGIWDARGQFPEKRLRSFVSLVDIPFLYSMTPGEYGLYAATTQFKRLRLSVIPVLNFRRRVYADNLSLPWINPSPNIPSPESSLVYAGMVFLEGINLNLGRGTTRPFIYTGAPWLDEKKVLEELVKLNLPGVQLGTVVFTPTSSKYAGRVCRGIQFHPLTSSFDPIRTAYEYMRVIKRLHPQRFEFSHGKKGYFLDRLWGSNWFRLSVVRNLPWDSFHRPWRTVGIEFEKQVAPYRLYGE